MKYCFSGFWKCQHQGARILPRAPWRQEYCTCLLAITVMHIMFKKCPFRKADNPTYCTQIGKRSPCNSKSLSRVNNGNQLLANPRLGAARAPLISRSGCHPCSAAKKGPGGAQPPFAEPPPEGHPPRLASR